MKQAKTLLAAQVQLKITRERLTTRQAAERAGVNHTTIQRVAKGHPPDIWTLRSLCKWLELNTELVLDDLATHHLPEKTK